MAPIPTLINLTKLTIMEKYRPFLVMKKFIEKAFFTDNINIAKDFRNIIFEVYLNINKTLDLRNGFSPAAINELKNSLKEQWMENLQPMTLWDIFDGDEGIYFVNVLRKHNYDSVIINECNQAGKVFSSYIVFDPENIHVNKK